MGWWDGSEVGGPGAGSEQLNYMSFGAGVSEVRVSCRYRCFYMQNTTHMQSVGVLLPIVHLEACLHESCHRLLRFSCRQGFPEQQVMS
jgi:hypothetical protein